MFWSPKPHDLRSWHVLATRTRGATVVAPTSSVPEDPADVPFPSEQGRAATGDGQHEHHAHRGMHGQ